MKARTIALAMLGTGAALVAGLWAADRLPTDMDALADNVQQATWLAIAVARTTAVDSSNFSATAPVVVDRGFWETAVSQR